MAFKFRGTGGTRIKNGDGARRKNMKKDRDSTFDRYWESRARKPKMSQGGRAKLPTPTDRCLRGSEQYEARRMGDVGSQCSFNGRIANSNAACEGHVVDMREGA